MEGGSVQILIAMVIYVAAESIFIVMSTNFFFPLFAGFVMAGILAATISSSDSFLLIAASAFSNNIYQGIMKKQASDKAVLIASRVTLIIIAIIAMIIALDKNSIILEESYKSRGNCRYGIRRRNGFHMEAST